MLACSPFHPNPISRKPLTHRLTPEQVMTWLHAAGLAEAHKTWQDAEAHLADLLLTSPHSNDLELLLQWGI
jgi:hypothetical protein